MTRIAVLADIHGNLPALEAVLADVEAAGADVIVLNGDLADGPFPAETIDVLTALGERALWVRGNSDRWLVDAFDGKVRDDDRQVEDLLRWAAPRLTRRRRDLLAALPLMRSIDVPGFGRIGFCHATARSDNEMLLVDSAIEHCRRAFSGLDAETIFVGHCHMPFDRLFDRRRVVNSGSVGMPYGHLGASWALVERNIALCRTTYDLDDAADRITRTGMPGAAEFIAANIRAAPSDVEALEDFGKIAREQQSNRDFD